MGYWWRRILAGILGFTGVILTAIFRGTPLVVVGVLLILAGIALILWPVFRGWGLLIKHWREKDDPDQRNEE